MKKLAEVFIGKILFTFFCSEKVLSSKILRSTQVLELVIKVEWWHINLGRNKDKSTFWSKNVKMKEGYLGRKFRASNAKLGNVRLS